MYSGSVLLSWLLEIHILSLWRGIKVQKPDYHSLYVQKVENKSTFPMLAIIVYILFSKVLGRLCHFIHILTSLA